MAAREQFARRSIQHAPEIRIGLHDVAERGRQKSRQLRRGAVRAANGVASAANRRGHLIDGPREIDQKGSSERGGALGPQSRDEARLALARLRRLADDPDRGGHHTSPSSRRQIRQRSWTCRPSSTTNTRTPFRLLSHRRNCAKLGGSKGLLRWWRPGVHPRPRRRSRARAGAARPFRDWPCYHTTSSRLAAREVGILGRVVSTRWGTTASCAFRPCTAAAFCRSVPTRMQ